MIIDGKAEALERAGLYRRAASRWLAVFDRCKDESKRELIAKRREACLEKALLPKSKLDNFSDVTKAARETQQRLGIARPSGEAFRNYNGDK